MPDPKDELHHLFRAAGHSGPDRDLTDRIMARVAVTPILRPTPVKPILGRTAWMAIGALAALVMVIAVVIGQGQESKGLYTTDLFNNLSTSLPATDNWAIWLAGLSASLVVLGALDRMLAIGRRSA
ncbi:MAG: hypothetical protein JNL52_10405 [Flavobacteriales bacterium]|nr:hypothetical protein [Flavobacteriales bacterium]